MCSGDLRDHRGRVVLRSDSYGSTCPRQQNNVGIRDIEFRQMPIRQESATLLPLPRTVDAIFVASTPGNRESLNCPAKELLALSNFSVVLGSLRPHL